MTLKVIAERLAAELSLPDLTTGLLRLGFEHQTFRMRGERANFATATFAKYGFGLLPHML